MSVLVVGTAAYDTVATPFGAREGVLGGSAVYFAFAASFFVPVRLVAVVGEDFDEGHVRVLAERGVDLKGLHRAPGRTFRWAGEYGYDLNVARTKRTDLGVLEGFRPRLPEPYPDSQIVFLANIDPEIQLDVLDQVRAPRLVACDTMNYWIEGKPEALRRALARTQILLINDGEARELAGEANLVRAARAIRAMGPETVVIKRGEYGAVMFREDSIFSAPAYPLEVVHDPTGAGDSFAGGFIGHLALCGAPPDDLALRQAVIYGSVLASLNVEAFSVDRLRTARPEEIEARYKEFRRLTAFEQAT